ncbi:fumarate hydratase class II [Cellvibrio zantedeschiae]|uniref:Fumarate hydratase class II n=1 Tax=Cellvibrio zantedeschiae TaxID=1237077 RepID=A0ABQ3B355_9GAMM|nr:class II fumarate hydratase [Cellvibrio zantedeschiae]GGY77810.1 fumarate hydratase class II [Cellvibrio zantedeschiae]
MTQFRTEHDTMGEVQVPSSAFYGAQTQRAIDNFSLSDLRLPLHFIYAVAHIKKAAAQTNQQLGLLNAEIARGIINVSEAIIAGEHADQFPIDVFQTGSGTSTNMNVNEVIAHIAHKATGEKVHANDHVNMGQSSNDTIPSAIHISAAIAFEQKLLPALENLHTHLLGKAEQLQDVVKTGRTHLMDAMPLTFGQEISGWASQIESNYVRLQSIFPQLLQLAQGGTAVGTGINAHPQFAQAFAQHLSENTGLPFTPANNFFALMSAQDTAVAVSGQLKTLAVSLMKIANDLRWMNSGPLAGLAEINLHALQPGSSIMPGKVNPVIPEAVCMVCAQVIGNDASISLAGQSGNFQLNVMLPLIAYNLLQSIDLLSNACNQLAEKAIANFTVNHKNIENALARNPILITALNSVIGYEKAAAIAKKAYKEGRAIIDVAQAETDIDRAELERLLNPKSLTGE